MSKKIRYKDDQDYSKQRLCKTVVVNKAKTRLLYINEVGLGDTGVNLYVRDVESLVHDVVTLAGVELEHPPLGMTLYYKTTLFVSRYPLRQYRQGLSWENISVYPISFGDGGWGGMPRDNSLDGLCFLYTPCLNCYPDFGTMLEMFDAGYRVVPLNRDVAVSSTGDVRFRTFPEPVGQMNFTTQKIKLKDRAAFVASNPTVKKYVE